MQAQAGKYNGRCGLLSGQYDKDSAGLECRHQPVSTTGDVGSYLASLTMKRAGNNR